MLKRCGTLLALLTVLTLLITCSLSPTDSYQPPQGMGAVRINFGETIQRTMLPDISLNDFHEFELIFTDTLGEKHSFTPEYTGRNDFINLPPETYNLKVTGYLGPNKTNEAARGSAANITVAAGGRVTVKVTLKCIMDEGEGAYTWDIDAAGIKDYPTAITAAAMNIYGWNDVSEEFDDLKGSENLIDNWTGTKENFDAGEYLLVFELTANGSTRKFEHILHIYQNLTTIIECKFTNDFFPEINIAVTAVKPTITYENPKDYPPVLTLDPLQPSANDGSTVDKPIVIHQGTSQTITITVSNAANVTARTDTTENPLTAADAYSSIKWLWNGVVALPPDTITKTISAGMAASDNNPYQLAVTGIYDGKEYITEIWIKVVD